MAGLPHQQQPCLVPGCSESLFGLRGEKLRVCRAHREAATVEIESGNPVRFCSVCYRFHPTAEFHRSSHICRSSERSHPLRWRARRRMQKNRQGATTTALTTACLLGWFPALRSTLMALLTLWSMVNAVNHDEGQQLRGHAVIAFLRGKTPTAKVALSILYAASCYFLGPHNANTWAIMAMAAAFLHLFLPHAHDRLYARPLQEVRRVAVQPGLAVSSSFQFLKPSDHKKYEQFLRESAGSSYIASVGRVVGIFFSAAMTSRQAFEAVTKVWGVSSTWPMLCFLVLLGMVYFPARLRALTSQKLTRCSQLLDGTVLILSSSLPILPAAYAWAAGAHSCGVPSAFLSAGSELELTVLGLLAVVASSASLFALLDGPISMVTTVTAAVTMIRASFCLFGPWCMKVETGLAISTWMSFLSFEAWLAGGIACVAWKVRHEKSRLLHYIHQLQTKQAEPLDSAAFYQGDPHLLLAVKMGSITPSHLPFNLRERILSTMQVVPESFTGVIRPGCVMLGLEMRFRSLADMRTAWTSLLSHCNWKTTLLDTTASTIDMTIQGGAYTVAEGQLQHRLHGIQGTSMIASVEPLVLSPRHSTLTLTLSGVGDRTFTVLLRCGGQYHKLEVQERSIEDPSTGLSTVVVRLPEAARDGMGWVEVMPDTPDGSLVLSEPSPILFTSVPEVAEELSGMLPAHCPDGSQLVLAGLLADLATCLHGQSTAPPLLLLYIAELGLTECFKHLATSAAALRDAELEGQGLLGSAVISGSEEMLELVISVLASFHLPVNPCKRAPDARGYTALHWAAYTADTHLVYMLLAEVPNPLESWRGCEARLCGKTPAQLMAEAGAACSIDEEMLRDADDPADAFDGSGHVGEEDADALAAAVWGSGVASALQQHPLVTHASLLALVAVMCVQLSWRDPLAWGTIGLTCFSLCVMVPRVYNEYLNGLAEVRGLAAEQGLTVSWALQFLGAPVEQGMYEKFVMQRAATQLLSSRICTAATVLTMTASMSQVFEQWGLWRHAPVLLCCAVLVSLQDFAILNNLLLLWRWLEPAIAMYCSTKAGTFVIAWMTHNPVYCNMPSSILSSDTGKLMLLGLLLPPVLAALMVFLFASVPKAPGAPVHLPSEVALVLFYVMASAPAAQWCINSITGMDNLGNAKNLLRVCFTGIWRLAMLGVRLRSEKQNLCAFLTARASRRAQKPSSDPCAY